MFSCRSSAPPVRAGGGCVPAAQEATLLHGQAYEARHPPGQETGGIIAPLSLPLGMEGYGHYDITGGAVGPPVIDQELRQGLGRCREALVFELVNSLPHHSFKTKGGAYAIDGRMWGTGHPATGAGKPDRERITDPLSDGTQNTI